MCTNENDLLRILRSNVIMLLYCQIVNGLLGMHSLPLQIGHNATFNLQSVASVHQVFYTVSIYKIYELPLLKQL